MVSTTISQLSCCARCGSTLLYCLAIIVIPATAGQRFKLDPDFRRVTID
jgi:hypothetical protein